jgi:hypothetical protein
LPHTLLLDRPVSLGCVAQVAVVLIWHIYIEKRKIEKKCHAEIGRGRGGMNRREE